MRSVKNAAYLMVPLCLGTYAYSSYIQTHKKKRTYLDTAHFSERSSNFIKENDLVVPEFFRKLKRDNSLNSFFLQSILQNVGGLDQFNIYMDKGLHSVVNKEVQVTQEEREKKFQNSNFFCLFVANKKVEDAEDVVHAGFTATLLDNMGGTLAFLSCGNKPVATASITVNYRKPIKTGDEYITEISTKKADGKKVIMQGLIKDKDGTIFAEADLMFIKVDWKNMIFSNIVKNIEEKVLGWTEKERNESPIPQTYMNVPDIVIDFQTDTKRKFRIGETYAKFC